jgi:hypothetical protein
MRAAAKFLEDHGVNMVFNGHEHNYQRTFPIRANANVAAGPSPSGPAAVSIDASFDGVTQTVPDGVLYLVEGAGGNRDFDGNLGPARGSGLGIDQDDSATGKGTLATFMFPNGPSSWLDTHLTSVSMSPVFPAAGNGPKITTRFKAKLFSFADIVVRDNKLTLYQISEPLLPTSSASGASPAPFGSDVNGNPVNDPIPDTLVDPATGNVVSAPADGPSALLDRFVVTKPDLEEQLRVRLDAPESVGAGCSVHVSLACGKWVELRAQRHAGGLRAAQRRRAPGIAGWWRHANRPDGRGHSRPPHRRCQQGYPSDCRAWPRGG